MKKVLILIILVIISFTTNSFAQRRKNSPTLTQHVEEVVSVPSQFNEPPITCIKIISSKIVAPATSCQWARKGDTIIVVAVRYMSGNHKSLDDDGVVWFNKQVYWEPISGYESDFTLTEDIGKTGDKKVTLVRKAVVL